MTRSEIETFVEEYTCGDPDEKVLLLDGLDEAFIGLTSRNVRAVYSMDKIIECLSKDMSEQDAWEYFHFNIECAYVGEKTPIYIQTL
jgi:hypothetical protein